MTISLVSVADSLQIIELQQSIVTLKHQVDSLAQHNQTFWDAMPTAFNWFAVFLAGAITLLVGLLFWNGYQSFVLPRKLKRRMKEYEKMIDVVAKGALSTISTTFNLKRGVALVRCDYYEYICSTILEHYVSQDKKISKSCIEDIKIGIEPLSERAGDEFQQIYDGALFGILYLQDAQQKEGGKNETDVRKLISYLVELSEDMTRKGVAPREKAEHSG